MNKTTPHHLLSVIALAGVTLGLHAQPTASPTTGEPITGEPITELERFIATETSLENSGEVLPTSRLVDSVFGSLSILETPRSVTVLTPELMKQFHIQDFSDIAKIGAGTAQQNYYGVPGSPTIRGAKGGVFFNGVQRAWQRNEMPLSFGSLEAMDIVKGPAPAHLGAAQVGGYTNLSPKSPYFDKSRGSVSIEAGNHDHYRIQTDVGGPFLLGDKPAAYRLSITGQLADSYYDRIGNDFISIYGSMKTQLAENVSIFTGAEYFTYKSNENAGWNRPTQALIDSGEYVIGEPVSLISPAWGGNAVRTLTEFPFTFHLSPPFSSPLLALAIPGNVARARIPDAQRALMIDMNDPASLARVYQTLPQASVPGFAVPSLQPVTVAALNQVAQTTKDVFIYTPAYFAGGGQVLTDTIEGSTVLADGADYANSTNLLYFLDIESTRNPDRTLKGQFLLDLISTEKLSTYGYAINTDQLVLETKATAVESFDFLEGMKLTYGLSARYTDAKMLQDFFAEPFSRRDISLPAISTNSVILTGPQTGPDGRNFWSPTAQGGANAHSKLWQFSVFAYAENKLTERITTFTSFLGAHAPYSTELPDEVDQIPAGDPRRAKISSERNYASFSFSPVIKLTDQLSLYATYQKGTALDALQGGAIVGKGNFAENELIEVGLKGSFFEDRLYAGVSVYEWEQSAFDQRTNRSEPLEGDGIEFELTAQVTEKFTLIASANVMEVRRNSNLGFRAPSYTAQEWALYGGVLAFQSAPGRPAANPDLVYPGLPETQVKFFGIYTFDNGFGLSGGPVISDSYWHNFDRTLKLPAATVVNANIFYRQPAWEINVALENVTGEDHFYGADPAFAANTIITKAPGFTSKVTLTIKF